MKKIVKCNKCGVDFIREYNAQKYCPTCRSLRAALKNQPKKSIGRLHEEARAAGMSYGQYVGKLLNQRTEGAKV